MRLYGWLGATAFARAGRLGAGGPFHPEGSTTADALHAADFYIDVVTPGGSYSTGSGQSYETPTDVAKPAAWLVLASGVLAIAALAHQRDARREALANFNQFGYIC